MSNASWYFPDEKYSIARPNCSASSDFWRRWADAGCTARQASRSMKANNLVIMVKISELLFVGIETNQPFDGSLTYWTEFGMLVGAHPAVFIGTINALQTIAGTFV